jgi:hypothetical protein
VADVFADGNTRVAYVPAISNIALATVTELNAGILLQDVITSDGLMGFEASSATVDTSALSSKFDTAVPGRDQFSGTGVRLKKQTATDTIFNTLTKGTTGYIVIRRGIDSNTAWASGQPLEVYPITCGREKRLAPTANSVEKYEIPTFVSAQPNLRAAVA